MELLFTTMFESFSVGAMILALLMLLLGMAIGFAIGRFSARQ